MSIWFRQIAFVMDGVLSEWSVVWPCPVTPRTLYTYTTSFVSALGRTFGCLWICKHRWYWCASIVQGQKKLPYGWRCYFFFQNHICELHHWSIGTWVEVKRKKTKKMCVYDQKKKKKLKQNKNKSGHEKSHIDSYWGFFLSFLKYHYTFYIM